MDTFSTCSSQLVLVVTIFQVVVLTSTTPSPVWSPQTSTGFGRNIRHLPCVSRRSGETGICMFAFSCAKANGTHLGTCIDRFYFGSCCKLELQNQDIAAPLDSNHIFEESPSVSTENYHISTYQSVQTVSNTTEILISQSTTTARTPTVSTTPKPTKKPVILNEQNVTVPPLVYTHKPITSSKPSVSSPHIQLNTTKPKPSSKPSHKPQTTSKPLSVSKPPTNSTKPSIKPPLKPVTSTKPKPSNTTSKPYIKPNPQKPINNTTSKPVKPPPTKRPTISSTTKPYRPSSQKPVQTSSRPTKPTFKPQTKPPLKPVPVVTLKPSTKPDYVQVPVVTVSSSHKPTVEPVSVSNEVVQKPVISLQSNQTVESEEENSNVINESAGSATTSSTLLVTWTTVDEVPVPPLPKPVSTPSSPPNKNETKPIKTTTTTTSTTTSTTTTTTTTTTTPSTTTVDLSFPTWVQVPVSTLGPTGPTKPSVTSGLSSTIPPSPSPTTTSSVNITVTETTSPVSVTTTSTELPSSTSTAASAPSTSTEISFQNSDVTLSNLNMSDYLDVCGRRLFPQSRIVGGDKATFGKWPWQISLRQWRTSTYLHKCGAALLNENWAITAAHCVENVAPSDLLLRLGEHDLSLEDEPYGYQERRVQIVASHPQFDPRTFEYDLALLRFYEPVTFQPNIIPVCVPQDDTNFVGSTAFVTGWGRLYEDGPLPSVLQEVSVPVINNTVCETMYRAAGYIEHIPEIFICAGWKKGGFDSCEGDSGGPMVIQRPDKRWLLAGVISWGIGCAEPNQPGVYTRISEFRGWINQILQF